MKGQVFKLSLTIFLSGYLLLVTDCEAGVPSQKNKLTLGCDKSIQILNGFLTFVDNGEIVLFECKTGFVPYGEMKASCNAETGQWDSPPPLCIKKGCVQPKIPINGKGEEEYSGALVKFSCDSGYQLVGDSEVTCNGKHWSGVPPLCKELPPQLIERKPEL